MGIFNVDGSEGVQFQQPTSAPVSGLDVLTGIVGGLSGGLQAASQRDPLDKFAKKVEPLLRSQPGSVEGVRKRDRQIQQALVDFNINNPADSDRGLAFVQNMTGVNAAQPTEIETIRIQEDQFFTENPTLAIRAVADARNPDGSLNQNALAASKRSIFQNALQKEAEAAARASQLAALEGQNKLRDAKVKGVVTNLTSEWGKEVSSTINAMGAGVRTVSDTQSALEEVRGARAELKNTFLVQATASGLTPSEFQTELESALKPFDDAIEQIEGFAGDFGTLQTAMENQAKLQVGDIMFPMMGSLSRTAEGRRALAEAMALRTDLSLKGLEALTNPATLRKLQGNPSDPAIRETVVQEVTEAVEDGQDPKDILTTAGGVIGGLDPNQPDTDKEVQYQLARLSTGLTAIGKPLDTSTLQEVFSSNTVEVLNATLNKPSVAAAEAREDILNLATNQVSQAVAIAEERTKGGLPQGLGIVFENGKFQLGLTGPLASDTGSSSLSAKEFVVLKDGKLFAMDDPARGQGGQQIRVNNARFALNQFNKVDQGLKAANFMNQKMGRISPIADEWRSGMETEFSRMVPNTDQSFEMPQNVKLNESMKPLVGTLEGASKMTKSTAAERMNAVLSGPFQQMQS